jgi:uncharacterized protein
MVIQQRHKPYLYGALSGILLTASVAITGNFFGTSTTFPRTAGLLASWVGVDVSRVALSHFATGPAVLFTNWQTWFVVGIGIGAFVMSKATGTFRRERLPEMWVSRFGDSVGKRLGFSILGGILAMIGARLAGGCPSGHGVSGVSQLGISSVIALAMFFVGGIAMARLLYGRTHA